MNDLPPLPKVGDIVTFKFLDKRNIRQTRNLVVAKVRMPEDTLTLEEIDKYWMPHAYFKFMEMTPEQIYRFYKNIATVQKYPQIIMQNKNGGYFIIAYHNSARVQICHVQSIRSQNS